ncbi:MAG: hypothetical protein ACRC2S_07185 [Waterburya sp.]
MGQYSFGRGDVLGVGLDFDLLSSDEDNNITPTTQTTNGITSYTFAGAVENFQGSFDDRGSDIFDFQVINITDKFAPSGDPITLEEPLNLDLVAKYIPTTNRIEYTFNNSELTNLGISEVTIVIPDQDKDTPGFQVNGKPIDTTTATNNLESISDTIIDAFSADNDYLNGTDGALDSDESVELRISGRANDDPNTIKSSSESLASKPSFPVTIEAEDIVDDPSDPNDNDIVTGYEEEDFAQADGSGLKLSEGESSGTISFLAGDYGLEGDYNLRINSFDENDGAGTIKVEVEQTRERRVVDPITGVTQTDPITRTFNRELGTINLNDDTDDAIPTEDNRGSYVIKGLVDNNNPIVDFGTFGLEASDRITITGTFSNSDLTDDADGKAGEFARIDFLTFDPVDI